MQKIRLTLPTATSGMLYENDSPLNLGRIATSQTGNWPREVTIKAIAFKTGFNNSTVTTVRYSVAAESAAATSVTAPVFMPSSGTAIIDPARTLSFGATTPSDATIHYTYTVSTTSTPPEDPDAPSTTSPIPGGSSTQLYNPGSRPTWSSLAPSGGILKIRAIAFKTPGFFPSGVASAMYTVSDRARPPASPAFSLTEETVYITQSLIITAADGATIHYTTNNDSPSPESTQYSAAILFRSLGAGEHTIRALAVNSAGSSSETMETFMVVDVVDADGDGLIEIYNLDMLNNIRYDIAGTSYKTSAGDSGNTAGNSGTRSPLCVGSGLCGYELMQDLDFANPAHYESGMVNMAWRPDNPNPYLAMNAGFPGIGD